MIRYCPNCHTERGVDEMFCEGTFEDKPCDWPLSGVALRQSGWRPEAAPPAPTTVPAGPRCTNGHILERGDLLCPDCGADLVEDGDPAPLREPAAASPAEPVPGTSEESSAIAPTVIGDWTLVRRLASTGHVQESYEAMRGSDGRQAILTLYAEGSEPDPEVYEVLRTLDRDHVPEVLDIGRFAEQVYEVSEDLKVGSLADLGLMADDLAGLSRIV